MSKKFLFLFCFFAFGIGMFASLHIFQLFIKPGFSPAPLPSTGFFPIQTPLKAAGWEEHSFDGHTQFQVMTDEAKENIIHASSRDASSAIYRGVKVSMDKKPRLVWEWKAVHFPAGKENKVFASKRDNDFAGRVYAVFGGRTPLTSDVIQYVWDDHFPEGTVTDSPYSKKVKILVIRQDKSSKDWVREERDLARDYEVLFGKKPKHDLSAVGLTSDSDNTRSQSEIYFRRIAIQTA